MEFIFAFAFLKRKKLLISSYKKNDIWAKANPNSNYIMYIGLEYVMASPKKVLYCNVKTADA